MDEWFLVFGCGGGGGTQGESHIIIDGGKANVKGLPQLVALD